MANAETKGRTVFTECGARTNFAPPPASLERMKVCDVDGRTMFDVYEPRYHADGARVAARKEHRPGERPPETLIEILEQRPALVLAVLFTLVLATSATVTALVHR